MSDDDAGKEVPEEGEADPLSGLSGLFGGASREVSRAMEAALEVPVTGTAGGGAVEITLSANLEALSVHISEEALSGSDTSMLEDLVLVALRGALAEAVMVREDAAQSLAPSSVDLGSLLSGLSSPAGGALGGALEGLGLGGGGLGELIGQLFSSPEDEDEDEDEDDEEDEGDEE